MGRIHTYFYMQFKRILKLFPVLLTTNLLVWGCVGALAVFFIRDGVLAEDQTKFRVGIVGDITDSYLGFGIYALQSLDDSRFMVDFSDMTQEEAVKELRQGKLTAYVLIPEGLVESLERGWNDHPITYVAAEGQKGFGGILMEEMAKVVSTLVTGSQSAVYGMQRVLAVYGDDGISWESTERLCLRLVEMVLNRTKFCELDRLNFRNGLSIEGYYFCTILIFFLLLSGINNSSLFAHRGKTLPKLLAARGVSAFQQVLGEYLAYLSLMLACLAGTFLILGVVLCGGILHIPECDGMELEFLAGFFVELIPMAAMLSALQFFLYELVTGIVSSVLLQFIGGIAMSYLSCYFYPEAFFPDAVARLGRILPTGAARLYVEGSMEGRVGPAALGGVFLYLLAFLGLSVLVRRHRIRRG